MAWTPEEVLQALRAQAGHACGLHLPDAAGRCQGCGEGYEAHFARRVADTLEALTRELQARAEPGRPHDE